MQYTMLLNACTWLLSPYIVLEIHLYVSYYKHVIIWNLLGTYMFLLIADTPTCGEVTPAGIMIVSMEDTNAYVVCLC